MRFLSLCSGIEAASVAWAPLGWKAWAFSEIAKFPSALLAHRFPTTPNLGDMTGFKEWPDATLDLLCGGTPCQSYSNAGLRAGLDDPRGQLMLTFGAVAARYRPRWLVWENVPGVLSSSGGRDFGAFLGLLGFLGYGFAYRVLDAQFVRVDGYPYAVPQRRNRVFVVGCLGDWRSAAAVLLERESLRGDLAPRREAGQRVAATLTRGAESGGRGGYAGRRQEDDTNIVAARALAASQGGVDREDRHTLIAYGGNNTAGPIQVATALNACASASGRMDFDSETFIAHTLRGEGFDASEDGTGRGTPLVPVAFALRGREEGAMPEVHGDGASVGALRAASGGSSRDYIAFDTTQITSRENRSNPQPGDPCHPLTRGGHAPAIAFHGSQDPDVSGDVTHPVGRNQGQETCALTRSRVRRLTPRECERLQGFPDDWTQIPYRGKPASDGPRYQAIGNSWAVPCARWIGQRIAKVDQLALRQAA